MARADHLPVADVHDVTAACASTPEEDDLRSYLVPFVVGIMLGFAAVTPPARPDCTAGNATSACRHDTAHAPLPADASHSGRFYFGERTIVI